MKKLRKTLVTLIGGSLLLIAIILIALPGTVILLPIALAILSLEYQWAKKYLKIAQKMLSKSAKTLDTFVAKCRRK